MFDHFFVMFIFSFKTLTKIWEFIFYHPDQNIQNSFYSGIFFKVIYGRISDFGISIMRKKKQN